MISKDGENHLIADEMLMIKMTSGDKNALMLLYNRYFNKLVWFAKTFVFNHEQAEDLVQEVFMKLIEQPNQFDSNLRFSTWIYTITANKCKNHLRDNSNRERLMKEMTHDESTTFHSTYDYHLIRDKIKGFIQTLTEKEMTLFVLRFEHQLTVKEISKILSMPEGSVKSGVFYMLKKISTHLNRTIK